MPKKKKIPTIELRPIPYFVEGSLVFKESGHTLSKSGEYYRCVLDSNQKCDRHEKQIKAVNLERNFANYAKKIELTEQDNARLVKKFMREVLIDVVMEVTEDDDKEDEMIDLTFAAAMKDLEKKGNIKPSDLADIESAILKQQQNSFPLLLMGYVMEAISAFSHGDINQGRFMSLTSKKIFLTDTGKIDSIELELWGWYIMNYLDMHSDGFLSRTKERGIIFTNGSDKLLEMELPQAARYLTNGRQSEALSMYRPSKMSNILEFLKSSMKMLTEKDPNKMKVMILGMLKLMNELPVFNALLPAMPLLRVKKPRGQKSSPLKP